MGMNFRSSVLVIRIVAVERMCTWVNILTIQKVLSCLRFL